MPDDIVDSMKLALKGAKLSINEAVDHNFEITRTIPHGHVCLITETMKKLGLDTIISAKPSGYRDLIMAMITARIINPTSKLATARGFNNETCSNSLGELLNLKNVNENELYSALDWLLKHQDKIENKLSKIHLGMRIK